MGKQNSGLKLTTVGSLSVRKDVVRDVLSSYPHKMTQVQVAVGYRDLGPEAAQAKRRTRVDHVEVMGKRTKVTRIVDTLGSLHKRGEITDGMLAAGVRFQMDFDVAAWGNTAISRYDGMPRSGQSGGMISLQILDAVSDTRWVVDRLGGSHAPCAIAIWCVLGLRWSIRELAKNQPFGDDKVWKGTLIGALGILAGEQAQKSS